MKPRIGRKVYCIYGDGIIVDTVGFLGKESFIIDSFGEETEPDSWKWDYDLYGEKWFTSLSKAKNKLIDNCKDKYEEKFKYEGKFKVVQRTDNWYMIEFC